ncbi:MAG TPA: hypothetical protein VGF49_18615 [Candidatus Solibacter sp.]
MGGADDPAGPQFLYQICTPLSPQTGWLTVHVPVDPPVFSSFNGTSATTGGGTVLKVGVSLTGVPVNDASVMFSSSDPMVASVPVTVVIPAGNRLTRLWCRGWSRSREDRGT